MITKDSLIFIVEDDKVYGSLILNHLKKIGFQNIKLFDDECQCLSSIAQQPEVLISDYNLNYMSGLKLIQEARKTYSGFYTILMSGDLQREHYTDDASVNSVDRYIVKGDNELKKLSEALDEFMDQGFKAQYF